MGFLSGILGGGGLVSGAQGVANVIDKFVETPDEKRLAEQIRQKIMMQPNLAQIELNKIEAQHRTVFVAGWRPFIGWVCGFALVWHFILYDMLTWASKVAGSNVPPPELTGTKELISIVMSLLGLGMMRTYEKLQGKAK